MKFNWLFKIPLQKAVIYFFILILLFVIVLSLIF
ncbi:MAG: hypothetical protein FD545_000528 [Pelagibacterales bacterium]|nr:hypothetical protein [Pelagibacterales bacterium]